MPIRARLAIAFATATLVIFSVAGGLFLRSFRHGLETQLDPGLRLQADSMTTRIRAEGASLDLSASTDGLRTNDAVAQVLTDTGRVVDHDTARQGRDAVIDLAVVRRTRTQPTLTRVRLGGEREPFRVLARPVPGDPSRITLVATSLEGVDEAVDRVRTALLAGGGLAVLLAGDRERGSSPAPRYGRSSGCGGRRRRSRRTTRPAGCGSPARTTRSPRSAPP